MRGAIETIISLLEYIKGWVPKPHNINDCLSFCKYASLHSNAFWGRKISLKVVFPCADVSTINDYKAHFGFALVHHPLSNQLFKLVFSSDFQSRVLSYFIWVVVEVSESPTGETQIPRYRGR